MSIDFENLKRALLGRADELLAIWLPGGRKQGVHYKCASISGGAGQSFDVNTRTGVWKDFATGEKGGNDLISLFAKIEGVGQVEAAKRLSSQIHYVTDSSKTSFVRPVEKIVLSKPPTSEPPPSMFLKGVGKPSLSWVYRDQSGEALFYVARYEVSGKKEFRPWSWQGDKFIPKGWESPRPLYGLDQLAARPEAPVLICEGEKACEAARKIAGRTYVAISWPSGTSSFDKTDWAPLKGRKVLIWPDADQPGIVAGRGLRKILERMCSVKLLNVEDMPQGWDAADALASGWEYDQFFQWGKARVEEQKLPEVQPQQQIEVRDANLEGLSKQSLFEQCGLELQRTTGKPQPNADNVLRVLERLDQFHNLFWFDEFHVKYRTRYRTNIDHVWDDKDERDLLIWLQRRLSFDNLKQENVRKAVLTYADRAPRNEAKDWLFSQIWDGTHRIDEFFVKAHGAEDNPYTRALSKNFLISLVARVIEPGIKCDNMVVLEGGQGAFKSTSLKILGGPWYGETHEDVRKNDFYMVLQGRMIVEMSELGSLKGAGCERIKQAISRCVDSYRKPYASEVTDNPRHSVFAGTTNDMRYLNDPSGGRRFWPVKVGKVDLDFIAKWRSQLFAEAVHRWVNARESFWEMPKLVTEVEQKKRQRVDALQKPILRWLTKFSHDRVDVYDICTGALELTPAHLTSQVQSRVEAIMEGLGWERGGEEYDFVKPPSARDHLKVIT